MYTKRTTWACQVVILSDRLGFLFLKTDSIITKNMDNENNGTANPMPEEETQNEAPSAEPAPEVTPEETNA